MMTKFDVYERADGREYMGGFDQDSDECIGELINLLAEFGPKRALTFLNVHHWSSEIVRQEPHTRRDSSGIPMQMFRYAFGIATSVSNDPSNESDDVRYSDIVHVLRSVQMSHSIEDIDPSPENDSGIELPDETRISDAVRDRELTVSRTAYDSQYIDAMRRAYTPFQTEFLQYKGIDISKSVDYAIQLIDLFSERVNDICRELRRYEIECLRIIGAYNEWQEDHDDLSASKFHETAIFKELKYAEKIARDELLQAAENRLWMSKWELKQYIDPMYEHRFENFLDQISIAVGSTDFRSPFDHNPIDEYPLIVCDNEYMVPVPMQFSYALAQKFYYDLWDIAEEENKEFGHRWGDYVEYWTEDIFRNLFPDAEIETNIKYGVEGMNTESDPEEISQLPESDVLIRKDEYLIVAECKTKRLNVKSRSGDYELIKEDLAEGIAHGADQSDRLIKGLSQDKIEFPKDKTELDIDFEQVEEYIPLVVVGTPYDLIATKEYTGLINDECVTPYVASTYDLEIISKTLIHSKQCSSDDFIEYVNKRINMAEKGYIHSMDEIDYTGMYISGNLERWIPILDAGLGDEPHARLFIGNSSNVTEKLVGDYFSYSMMDLGWSEFI